MGRWGLLLIVVIIGISPGMAFLYLTRERVVSPEIRMKREAVDQSVLQAYSEQFRPGLTRKDVEEQLGRKGIQFGSDCCSQRAGTVSDIVEIQREEHPWYCSEAIVYIAFEFDGAHFGPPKSTDILNKVSIVHRLEGCL